MGSSKLSVRQESLSKLNHERDEDVECQKRKSQTNNDIFIFLKTIPYNLSSFYLFFFLEHITTKNMIADACKQNKILLKISPHGAAFVDYDEEETGKSDV